jgi:hypothetical protein
VTPLVESLARKYQQYTTTAPSDEEDDEGRLPTNKQEATTQKYNTTIPIKSLYPLKASISFAWLNRLQV